MAYVTATIAEMHSDVVLRLQELAQALDDLKAAVEAVEVDTAALASKLDAIHTKLGAGLPSSLHNGRVRVTDTLL